MVNFRTDRRRIAVAAACLAASIAPASAQAPPRLRATGEFLAAGGDVARAAFDAEARWMVSCGEAGDLLVRDLTTGALSLRLPRLAPTAVELDVRADGRLAVLACRREPGLVTVDLAAGHLHVVDDRPARAAAFSPSGDRLAWIGLRDGEHRVHIAGLGATAGATRSAPLAMAADTLRWSPDGRRLVVMLRRTSLPIEVHFEFDPADLDAPPVRRPGMPLGWTDGGDAIVERHYRLRRGARELGVASTFAVSRRGGHVAARAPGPDADQCVRRWLGDRADAEVFDLGARVRSIALAPDGTLVGCDQRGGLHVVRADGERAAFGGHLALGVRELVFSPDGRWVAAAAVGGLTVASTKGTGRHVLSGSYAVGPGEAGSEFWLADRSGLRRHLAPIARTVTEVIAWPDAVRTVSDRDAFGGPDEHDQRTRSLLRVGFGDELVLRQGRRPQLHWFDPAGGRFERLSDPQFALPDGEVVEVAWSVARQLLVLVESSIERLGSGGGPLDEVRITAQTHALRVFTANGKPVLSYSLDEAPTTLAVSPDGDRYLLATREGSLLHFELGADGTRFRKLGEARCAAPLRWLGWLDDRRAIGHDGRSLRWFDIETLTDRGAVPMRGDDQVPADEPIDCAALSADASRLALARGAAVRVFSIDRR